MLDSLWTPHNTSLRLAGVLKLAKRWLLSIELRERLLTAMSAGFQQIQANRDTRNEKLTIFQTK